MVGDDDVRAGAFEARQRLQHDAALVYPALSGGGFDHAVFAAHVVGSQRKFREGLLDAANHVQIRQSGLDHEHIRAFGDVYGGFAQSLAPVGGVHLMGRAVAEFGRALRRVAEGTVKARRVLHRIRENGEMREIRLVQRGADGAHHAVHHAGGGDDIRSGFGVADRHFAENIQRGVVEDVAFGEVRIGEIPALVRQVQQPAMPVTGVFAEADIGHDDHFGEFAFDGAYRPLDDSLRRKIFQPDGVFFRRDAKEDDRRNADLEGGARLADGFFDGELGNAGHG